ncbi:MAG TPA: NAD(P)/FAD-dependent oxidoreductase, partial [Micromonosporaceae bacterium]|nr:NAD(P)/FAD-dependent oxidoreductase [Micromonosporaceae bacterium]
MNHHVHVAIIGSGFGGLGMAIRLGRAGIDDYVVLERADDVGGTWRDNSYPGCACDVPSHLYSFSFAPNPDWSRTFSPRAEIWAYLRRCADRFGVTPKIRFGADVRAVTWEPARRRWLVETTAGDLTADVVVAASGGLSEPAIPALPGLADFAGTAFHSARWRHDHDLTDRNVAVIGTGASAIQFVPRIQPAVGALHVFQRTPPWIIRKGDRAITGLERRAYRAAPALQRLSRYGVYAARESQVVVFRHPRVARLAQRIALRHLRDSVPDPALRAKLTPEYTFGCKRVLPSNDYLPALTRSNVELVTEPIARVRPHAVVTADGRERPVDTIIFGTGFRVTDPPIAHRVRGVDGRTLVETWGDSMRAHLGTMIAGFPNFFMLSGPNTGLGHTSVVLMIEAQIGHVLDALAFLRERGYAALAPRPGAQAAYSARIDAGLAGTVWNAGGCASWYLDPTGRNSTLWPATTWSFRRRLAR